MDRYHPDVIQRHSVGQPAKRHRGWDRQWIDEWLEAAGKVAGLRSPMMRLLLLLRRRAGGSGRQERRATTSDERSACGEARQLHELSARNRSPPPVAHRMRPPGRLEGLAR